MTDKLREAAQQALDALEHHTAIKHPQQRCYRDDAIEALREALAEPNHDYPCRSDGRCQYAIDHGAEGMGYCPNGMCVMVQHTQPDEDKAVCERNLRVAREMFNYQTGPVQEPVAVHQFRKCGCSDWVDGHPDHTDGGGPYETRTLYTAPPEQRKPLSDEEIEALLPEPDGTAEVDTVRVLVAPGLYGTEYTEADAWKKESVIQVVRAVEAAHGITGENT